ADAASSSRGSDRAPSRLAEEARLALGAQWESRDEELFGPAEALHSIFRERRDELLAGVARLGAALTPRQREVLSSSPLDELLLATASDARARTAAMAARDEPTLEAFLPRRGDGLGLAASDGEAS